MNRDNRPEGRKKNVGSGTGRVGRRGDGLSGMTGGPVGNADGYSDRPGGYSSGNTGGSGRTGRTGWTGGSGGTGYTGGSNRGAGDYVPLLLSLFTGKKKSKNLIFIIIGIVIVYFLFTKFSGKEFNLLDSLFGSGDSAVTGMQDDGQSVSTYADKGAYAVDRNVSELARSKRTVLQGGGKDTATIMIYMCGTDLESNNGMATADLQEILDAEISDKLNIIVETGGTANWKNNVMSNKTNQRYQVTSKGLKLLQDDLGKKPMVKPDTLADFIKYSKENFPADRYWLIFWDHGGGSLTAYGYDQLFPNDSMTLDEISSALKNGGCKFDVIGFDACLMATLETAIVLEPYADYMIASEEVEPGIGWYYTSWIDALSENTSIETIDIGKIAIDEYVREVKSRTPSSQATLSLIDLAELKGTVPRSFEKFSLAASKLIDEKEYKVVSDARANTKEFSPSTGINQIDLVHFAENMGTTEAKAFSEVLQGCIKYNRTSVNISNSNGVSIFFPYGSVSKVNAALTTYDKIGIEDEYSNCIKSFASLMAGGQITASGSNNLLSALMNGLLGGTQEPQAPSGTSGSGIVGSLLDSFLSGGSSGGNSDGNSSGLGGLLGGNSGGLGDIAGDLLGSWLDGGKMKAAQEYYEENRIDPAGLIVTEKYGQRVLALPEEQWDLIQHMEMNVFIDDGEGFIDLGLDNVYEYNDDGDLLMEYDGTWLALNGQIVSYYMVSDDRNDETYSIKGRVPALLKGQLVDIIIVFDNDNPDGIVLGAQIKYDAETETETIPKGLLDIAAGDKIDFLCDYYTYEGEYSNTYYLGEQYTATGDWTVENLSLGEIKYQMTYRITDIYGNHYWTESMTN